MQKQKKRRGGWLTGKKEEKEEEKSRNSKDKKIDGEGKKLLEFIEKRGWEIFNGNIEGDEEGEFTYTREREREYSDRLYHWGKRDERKDEGNEGK